MTAHPTTLQTNVQRRVLVHLESLSLGVPLVPAGDERAPAVGSDAWVRVTFGPLPGSYAGRLDGTSFATREGVLVSVDCWQRSNETEAASVVDLIDQLADRIKNGLRYVELGFIDYLSGGAPVAIAEHPIRAIQPPEIEPLPPMDGYLRRLVRVPLYWFSKHTR